MDAVDTETYYRDHPVRTLIASMDEAFVLLLDTFVMDHIVRPLIPLSQYTDDAGVAPFIRANLLVRRWQLDRFLMACASKLRRARIEPGTAVGALGAQSKFNDISFSISVSSEPAFYSLYIYCRHWRAWDADDAKDVSFCWSCFYECDAWCTAS
jgi:hypothetical protein